MIIHYYLCDFRGLEQIQTHLPQGGVLHRHLAEEEVDVVTVVDGVQEVGLCR